MTDLETAMYVVLAEHDLRLQMHERQQQAAAHNRAARLLAVRRWDRRSADAARRARLARTAVL